MNSQNFQKARGLFNLNVGDWIKVKLAAKKEIYITL